MKLALATLSIIRIDADSQPGSNVLLRSNSVHPIKIWRPSGSLVARWHVSRATGQIECSGSLEKAPTDDYLCAKRRRIARRLRTSFRPSRLRAVAMKLPKSQIYQ